MTQARSCSAREVNASPHHLYLTALPPCMPTCITSCMLFRPRLHQSAVTGERGGLGGSGRCWLAQAMPNRLQPSSLAQSFRIGCGSGGLESLQPPLAPARAGRPPPTRPTPRANRKKHQQEAIGPAIGRACAARRMG